ncbi:MAG: branched-chain amino acid ABC transporter permease [Anaerolineae bacterium]|jgi:branched-chain amino acid transport system permease protein
MVTFLNIVIAGLLLGGLYALIAMGLSLQYGVARVANFSHGEFIMLGGLTTWSLHTALGLNPLLSLAVCGPLTFILGYILHRTLFKRLFVSSASPGIFESNSMLASFALLFIIQNIASILWGPEIRGYSYLRVPVNLAGAVFGANRLVTLGFAVVIGLVFYLLVARTRMGKAIRAAAQDPATAGLMGVDIDRVLALCFGFGAAMAGIAGMLLSLCYPVHVVMGQEYTIIAMIVVVLGGLGSIPGSFIGGFLLGLIGSVVTHLDPGLSLVAYYLIFILLLLVRPTGIMGR